MAKYGSKKCQLYGYTFDSKKEGRRYLDLRDRQKQGEIVDLRVGREATIPIIIGRVHVKYESGRQMVYIPDFTYRTKDGTKVIEDVKSEPTRRKETYRIKKALLLAMGLEITEWM